jgi:Predicted hydrolases or acyltransferases (alpha/beta hydrolase superfamily)
MTMAKLSPIRGGYVYLPVQDDEYRVYYEEAGEGIPLILMHTAGTDGRLYRHLLEDPELTRHFRIVAIDLPYHGKSLPPVTREWWKEEYKLTTSFLFDFMLAINDALELDRPVYMGASMGGHLAVDLAISRPEHFRAVIGLEAGLDTASTAPSKLLEWFWHPRISNEMKAALMHTMMSPTSPEHGRREVDFIYSQGAPAAFKGDLNYYGVEHDVRETAKTIDTSKCAMYILGGEYDWSGTPEVCRALHDAVEGSSYTEMMGLGHFPMSENPDAFKAYILPVLDDIRARLS